MWSKLILWIVVAVFAIAIDIFTSSFLFVWFGIGGIVAIILTVLHFPFLIQFIAFIATSLVLLAIGYPIVKKAIKNTIVITPTMEEEYIGKEFISNYNIKDKANIKFKGIYWTVKNIGENINKGDKVVVLAIEGNKLVVKKL
ncbi:NfeD family protein [Clostridium sp. MB40-C1]|uniref:NfeD family protein n=1 Tax=Clostridium sp. MB40-C1 TaxID=3070996 RepID=UPI0027DF3D13|nr:NfeD family protein [Clostridium sp. MB40-C1]WMJ82360.1 NfeD family protein [Clostridium sp. MB40-C1]